MVMARLLDWVGTSAVSSSRHNFVTLSPSHPATSSHGLHRPAISKNSSFPLPFGPMKNIQEHIKRRTACCNFVLWAGAAAALSLFAARLTLSQPDIGLLHLCLEGLKNVLRRLSPVTSAPTCQTCCSLFIPASIAKGSSYKIVSLYRAARYTWGPPEPCAARTTAVQAGSMRGRSCIARHVRAHVERTCSARFARAHT